MSNLENTQAQMRRGVLEFCILSIIGQGEVYPSDIIAKMKDAKLMVVEGTLYPLLTRLKKGDEIITTGGILAKIVSLEEQYIKVSPAEGVEINLQKGAVSTVLPKGTLKSL